jgi:hypothetical protein
VIRAQVSWFDALIAEPGNCQGRAGRRSRLIAAYDPAEKRWRRRRRP